MVNRQNTNTHLCLMDRLFPHTLFLFFFLKRMILVIFKWEWGTLHSSLATFFLITSTAGAKSWNICWMSMVVVFFGKLVLLSVILGLNWFNKSGKRWLAWTKSKDKHNAMSKCVLFIWMWITESNQSTKSWITTQPLLNILAADGSQWQKRSSNNNADCYSSAVHQRTMTDVSVCLVQKESQHANQNYAAASAVRSQKRLGVFDSATSWYYALTCTNLTCITSLGLRKKGHFSFYAVCVRSFRTCLVKIIYIVKGIHQLNLWIIWRRITLTVEKKLSQNEGYYSSLQKYSYAVFHIFPCNSHRLEVILIWFCVIQKNKVLSVIKRNKDFIFLNKIWQECDLHKFNHNWIPWPGSITVCTLTWYWP